MLKNKCRHALLIVFLLIILPLSAFASESLISPEMIKAETVNYDVHTVEYGIYQKNNSRSVSEVYPYTYQLRFEQSGATFVEYYVRRGAEVKKGDVLASFSLETDDVTLTSKKLSLKRMENAFMEGKLSRAEAIQTQKENLLTVSDPYDQAIAVLQIQRAEIALEQYIYQQELNINALREEIEEAELLKTQTTLISPFDGVVEDINFKRAGDVISPNEVLITIYREDYMLLRVENKDMNFRYGMDVNLEVGRNKNKTLLPGKVVGADTLLPESRRNGYAYILLEPYDPDIRLTAPKAIVSTYYLENVIVVPRKSLTLEGGKYFVYQLIDGIPRKRFVNYIMQNNTSAWVIQGLDMGDTIVID